MAKNIRRGCNIVFIAFLSAVAFLGDSRCRNRGGREALCPDPSLFAEAFAARGGGGFGGGGFGAVPKTGKKKKANKNNKRRENLAEMIEERGKPAPKSTSPAETKGPELDRWGLPVATLEDIFPPLPESTRLDPVEAQGDCHSLSEIRECLRDHVDLGEIDRVFDDRGRARVPNLDGSTTRLRLLHCSPPVLALDDFLTADECCDVRGVAEGGSPTHRVGSATFRGALSARTSTSWFCHYRDLPALVAKANCLLGVPLETMEEPQIVRYRGGEEFDWHYDVVPPPQLPNGGQRVATLLVYLTDVPPERGGGTAFRDMRVSSGSEFSLVMQPQRGSALLFFPSFADGTPDDRTLHRSEVMKGDANDGNEKWIVQMWIHQCNYRAALPDGNSSEAARGIIDETIIKLGYDKV